MFKLKQDLLRRCSQYAEERIKSAADAIAAAKEASQDDTKSSAGDKYETTREMMQQEISRNEAQLFEAGKLKHALSQISIETIHSSIQLGSVVITDNGYFFIAVSAGQFVVEGKTYFAISSGSPIGRELLGLKKADTFGFNGKKFQILDVF